MKHIVGVPMLCLVIVKSVISADPPGHMKRVGSHMEPLGGIEEMWKFPSSRGFYEKFVKKSKPFVMRKVLENGIIPAYHKWNDTFLSDVVGDEIVDVEVLKDEGGSEIVQMKMKDFIKKYEKLDGYLVNETTSELIEDDIYVPWTLHCGGFQDSIEAVFIYMSKGGNKSPLHSGDFDNIYCHLDGGENLFMADKKHKDLVHADFWVPSGGMSKVNPQKVDMYKFPKLQKLPWYNVTLNKGDCIFIPVNWFYQSNVADQRSLILNFWFNHIFWHNKSECEGIHNDALPLSKFDVLDKDDNMRLKLFESFEEAGREVVKFDELFSHLSGRNSELTRDTFKKWFQDIDQDENGFLSWEEIQTSDFEKIEDEYPEIVSFLENEESDSVQTKPIKENEDESEDKEKDEDEEGDTKKDEL